MVLALSAGIATTLTAALQAHAPVTLSMVVGAIFTAASASRLYSWGRKLTTAAKGQAPVLGSRVG